LLNLALQYQLKNVRSFVHNITDGGFPGSAHIEKQEILQTSAGAYDRILKLAPITAELAGCEEIQSMHLAEALQYLPKLMLS